jgi:hypothetical protein
MHTDTQIHHRKGQTSPDFVAREGVFVPGGARYIQALLRDDLSQPRQNATEPKSHRLAEYLRASSSVSQAAPSANSPQSAYAVTRGDLLPIEQWGIQAGNGEFRRVNINNQYASCVNIGTGLKLCVEPFLRL